MKQLKFELVPRWRLSEPGGLTLSGEWNDIVDSFDVQTLLFAITGDYQGDYHYLLYDKNNGEYAYLTIGYGSCSGCDWMSSMNDYGQSEAEWYAVRDDLYNGLTWKTKPDMLAWLRDPARLRDFSSYYEREWSVFIDKCIAKLGKKKYVEVSDDG